MKQQASDIPLYGLLYTENIYIHVYIYISLSLSLSVLFLLLFLFFLYSFQKQVSQNRAGYNPHYKIPKTTVNSKGPRRLCPILPQGTRTRTKWGYSQNPSITPIYYSSFHVLFHFPIYPLSNSKITPIYYSSFHFLFHYPYIPPNISPIYYSSHLKIGALGFLCGTLGLLNPTPKTLNPKNPELLLICSVTYTYEGGKHAVIGFLRGDSRIAHDPTPWSLTV